MTRLLLGWPLPRISMPLCAGVMAIATVFATRALLDASYVTWQLVSSAWHESLPVPMSVAAGYSAWIAASLLPRASPLALAVRPRAGAASVARHLVVVACWAVLGLVLGMIPVTAKAALTASWGYLHPFDVLTACVGLAGVVAFGFVAGVMVRSPLVALPVGLAVLILTNVVNSPRWRPLSLLQPVQEWSVDERFVLSASTTAFSVVAGVTIVVGSVALGDALLRPRHQWGAAHAACVGAPVVLALVAFAWNPPRYVDIGVRPAVCDSSNGVTVCQHRAHAGSLGTVADVTHRIRAAGTAPLIDSVSSLSLMGAEGPTQRQILIDPLVFIPETVEDRTAEGLTEVFQPPTRCTDDTIEGTNLGGVLRQRVLIDAGFEDLNSRYIAGGPELAQERELVMGMTTAQLMAFVAEHRTAIEMCELTRSDFSL